METLIRQVRQARRRLWLQALGRNLAWCWFVALLLAALAIAAGKLWPPPLTQSNWATAWLAAALAGGLMAAVIWTQRRSASLLAAAVELDRRFGLKERVSSSLALDAHTRESQAAKALVHDAVRRAERIDVAERFSLTPDRRALLPLPAAVAFALAVILPVRTPPAPAQPSAPAASVPVQQATQTLAKRLEAQKKEALEQGLREADSIAKLEEGIRSLSEKNHTDHKQALLELNDLVKDAQARRQELAESADLKKQLAGLKSLRQGPAEALGQALKQGDLDKALKELDKLQQQLAAGKLEPEVQQQLAQQLDQLKQQLAEKAQAQREQAEQLKEQLEAARRAGDRQAAEQLERQLEQLAKQQSQSDRMGDMAAQLQQAAESLSEGDCQQAAEALEQLGDQLAGMQDNLQEMEALDAALDGVAQCKQSMACKSCEGDGCGDCQGDEWKKTFGQLDPFAQRGGGKGIGVGLGPGLGEETDPQAKFYDSAVRQQAGRGAAKVVGQADGPNRKGTVQQEIQTEFATVEQSSADALSEQRLPRDYRDHAQKYFDALREGRK